MTAEGLAPGQPWAIPAGGPWQARLDRAGRAHVIGRALAEHAEHGPRYADRETVWRGSSGIMCSVGFPRPWHTFARANRAASYHERLWLAAKRNAAQAGQGGG